MKYSIIIPTYTKTDLLKKCIDSIFKYTHSYDIEIIVIPNGAPNKTMDMLDRYSESWLRYKWFDKAIGYTKAVNEGIKEAKGEYIVLLNDDTELLPQEKNSWLNILHYPFTQPEGFKVAVTGPMKEKTETLDREFILFFCAMIPKRLFDELGLLDEIFSPGYGEDSVTGDTPVIIRKDGMIDILPIEELYTGLEDGRQNICDTEVYTRSGWAKLNFSYRHTVNKKIYRIRTRSGQINVTGDHSLFSGGKEVKVSELKVGDRIDLKEESPLENNHISQIDAWEQGFFCAEGSVSINKYRRIDSRHKHPYNHIASCVSVCQYGDIGSERIERVCRQWGWTKREYTAASTSTHEKYYKATLPSKSLQEDAKVFRKRYYTEGKEKKVPINILNSDNNTILNFLEGYVDGDGHHSSREGRRPQISFTTKSPTLAFGVQLLYHKLGRFTSINTRKDKPHIFNVRVLNGHNPDCTGHNPGVDPVHDDGTIREVTDVTHLYCDDNGFTAVYDINTDDGTFVVGMGGIIAHNTDFALRAENAGYKTVRVPADAEYTFYDDKRRTSAFPIWHVGNATFKDHPDPELIHRNNRIIFERYGAKDNKQWLVLHADHSVTEIDESEIHNVKMEDYPMDTDRPSDSTWTEEQIKNAETLYNGFASTGETIKFGEPQKSDIEEQIKAKKLEKRFSEMSTEERQILYDMDLTSQRMFRLLDREKAKETKKDIPEDKHSWMTPERRKALESKDDTHEGYKATMLSDGVNMPDDFIDTDKLNAVSPKDDIPEGLFQQPFTTRQWYPEKEFEAMKELYKDAKTVEMVNIERAKQIDGFMSDEELLFLARLATTTKVFVEIGSWHGKSAAAISDNIPEDGVLICVDTWQGSVTEQNTHHASAKGQSGDDAYLWFLNENWDNIQEGKIIPFRMTSQNAAKFLQGKYITADVIFIDAGHTYEEVKADIESWLPVLKNDGLICGHDYGTSNPELAGVTKAVNEVFMDTATIEPFTSIWKVHFGENAFELPNKLSLKVTASKDEIEKFTKDIIEYERTNPPILRSTPPRRPCVFDCFPFNNELDILEIRLNELYEVVDRFVIVEAKITHSGKEKELVFHNNLKRFEKFLNKITYLVIEKFPEQTLWTDNPNWARENYQRDYIMNGLKDCQDNDVIIISDADEIPKAEQIKNAIFSDAINIYDGILSFEMDLYYYNFNTNAIESWKNAKVLTYGKLKTLTPCGARYVEDAALMPNAGWHFSYFGSRADISKKIQATAHQEYNTDEHNNFATIHKRIINAEDIFGRENIKFKTIPRTLDWTTLHDLPNYVRTNVEILKKYILK